MKDIAWVDLQGLSGGNDTKKALHIMRNTPGLKNQHHVIHIAHDDLCPRLLETGVCNCNPDIFFIPVKDMHEAADVITKLDEQK